MDRLGALLSTLGANLLKSVFFRDTLYGCNDKNRTEYYLDWILSETGIEEPTEAPATTPTTAVPTEPPTTLPPFICPEGWVDSKTGCFKLLHTEVRNGDST